MMIPRSLITLALVAGSVAVALGCGDPTATAPGIQAPVGKTASDKDAVKNTAVNTGLVKCDPLSATTASATIDSSGGVLYIGPHSLSIPANALDRPVTITAVIPADSVNVIQFQPEGLVFATPAKLTMDYKNCRTKASLDLRIAHVDDAFAILGYLSTQQWDHKVKAWLQHFSNYAVAY